VTTQVLRDAADDERLRREGFVVVDVSEPSIIRHLRRRARRLPRVDQPAFHSTINSADERLRDESNRLLEPIGARLVADLLVDHVVVANGFVTKRRGPEGEMRPHQDWTFVDERSHASFNLWMPLVDVDRRNGALCVLPGSHRLAYTIRGTRVSPALEQIKPYARDLCRPVPMRAGQVLIHDHRLVHASRENHTRRPRVVASFAAVPRGVQPLHFARGAGSEMELHLVDRAFFDRYVFDAADESLRAPAERFEFDNPEWTERDLDRLVRRPVATGS
jgi:ectoine hydroxylase-related dioxygenase (phytanoyl-CoA dioxygenase family)